MNTKTINFLFKDESMEIFIGNNCIEEIAVKIKSITDNIMLVIDSNISKIYGDTIIDILKKYLEVSSVVIDAQEINKNFTSLEYVLDKAVEQNITRNSVVVSLGGGLIGNIAGLASGLLFRGIPLIHIPTTLLAMSDSILSCKQAVNGENAKNIYGLFHIAKFSGIDTNFLNTLPQEQLIAGFIELCKNVLTFDINNIEECITISEEISKLKPIDNNQPIKLNSDLYTRMVLMGIGAKQTLLINDPLEKHEALILEYGHTVGHAIELESNGEIPHGIAVGLGMLVASKISYNRNWLSKDGVDLHFKLLNNCSSLIKIPPHITISGIISRIKKDNKRGYIKLCKNEYTFILLRNIGQVEVTSDLPLCSVSEAELIKALKELYSI